MELKDRQRKLDITNLPEEQVDIISKQIGEKIRQICDKACKEANGILGVYGMTAKMQILVEHPDLIKKALEPAMVAAPSVKKGTGVRKPSQSLS
jgi:hypothetical protein